MRREPDLHAIVHVRPFGMMVRFLGQQGDFRHEAEGLDERAELEASGDAGAIRIQRPRGQGRGSAAAISSSVRRGIMIFLKAVG